MKLLSFLEYTFIFWFSDLYTFFRFYLNYIYKTLSYQTIIAIVFYFISTSKLQFLFSVGAMGKLPPLYIFNFEYSRYLFIYLFLLTVCFCQLPSIVVANICEKKSSMKQFSSSEMCIRVFVQFSIIKSNNITIYTSLFLLNKLFKFNHMFTSISTNISIWSYLTNYKRLILSRSIFQTFELFIICIYRYITHIHTHKHHHILYYITYINLSLAVNLFIIQLHRYTYLYTEIKVHTKKC